MGSHQGFVPWPGQRGVGDSSDVEPLAARQNLVQLDPLQIQMQIMFPGESDRAVKLNALPDDFCRVSA